VNPSTGFRFRAQAKKIPGPILIDPGMSHFYPQDPAKATFGPRRFQQNLRKTPLFAQFLRHAQISILEILNVFLRLKFSPFLNWNKNQHFSKVSMPFVRTGLLTSPPLQRPSHSDSKSGAHGRKGSIFLKFRYKLNSEKGEVTAAGPSPILTGFPIKLITSIRTPASIKKKRIECQEKNKKVKFKCFVSSRLLRESSMRPGDDHKKKPLRIRYP